MSIVLQSANFRLRESSRSVQTSTGVALPFFLNKRKQLVRWQGLETCAGMLRVQCSCLCCLVELQCVSKCSRTVCISGNVRHTRCLLFVCYSARSTLRLTLPPSNLCCRRTHCSLSLAGGRFTGYDAKLVGNCLQTFRRRFLPTSSV